MAPDEQTPPALLPETWSVKEVVADLKKDLVEHLDRQDVTLAQIDRKVDTKADKADLVTLTVRLDKRINDLDSNTSASLKIHDVAIRTVSEQIVERVAVERARRRVWAAIGTGALVAATLFGGFLYNLFTTAHHP